MKLMIVDDEKTTRDGLINCVPWKELGIDSVEEAEDGLKAIGLALHYNPQIILTDVRMPRMNGIQLAAWAKEQLPNCQVIFLSGYSDKAYLRSAIQLQAIDYIEKPVNIEEVKTIIQKTVSICRINQDKIEQTTNLQEQFNQNSSLINEKLVWELLNTPDHASNIREKFQKVRLNYPNHVQIVIAALKLSPSDRESNLAVQYHHKNILETIQTRFQEHSLHCLSGFQGAQPVISVIYGEKIDRLQIKTIFEIINSEINEVLGDKVNIFVGIGKFVSDVTNIGESHQTALSVIQKHFFSDSASIVFYEPAPNQIKHFDTELKAFKNLISEEKVAEAVFLIKQIVQDIHHQSNPSVHLVKHFFIQVMLFLSKLAADRNMLPPESSELFSWDAISNAETLSEIQTYIIGEIQLFFKMQTDRNQQSRIVFNITRLIHKDFSNSHLSIKELADQLFLTPNYLCLLFKKETGKTINQYIAETRIEKAKELLKNRCTKLYEVAELVGYSDSNYFSKIFKKLTGFNPSEYREKYLL